jgi:hypothetical protein
MRAPACALAALSLAIALSSPASAQSYGPSGDGYRSGPPSYFTERPPARSFEGDDDRGPSRGAQDAPWPPAPRGGEPPHPPQERMGDVRSHPPEPSHPRQPPVRTYRQAEPAPPPELDRHPSRERETTRRTIVTTKPPAPRPTIVRDRDADHGRDGPGQRVMIGPNEMVISIVEYEELRSQARELQRLLGRQSDRRDERRGGSTTTIYR